MLKKANANQILCECSQTLQFIYRMNAGVFNIVLEKTQKNRLGLLRLLLPSYVKSLSSLLDKTLSKHKEFYPKISAGDILNALPANL